MEANEFTKAMEQMTNAVRIANDLLSTIPDEDIAMCARTIELADSVGTIFDPSAWVKANKDNRLKMQREVVDFAIDARKRYRRLEELGDRAFLDKQGQVL